MRRAGLLALALLAASCVETFRGAIVQMNLRSMPSNADGQHYELFAVVNGGVVSVAKFKVLDAIEQCGQDPLLAPDVQLVQAYHDGMDAATQCHPDGRIGSVDRIDTASGVLLGGIRIDTPVDLSGAESVFVTVEADGETDPRPSYPVVLRGDVARGVDPFFAHRQACLDAFCAGAGDPPPDVCVERPEPPRERRGVLLGTLVRAPAAECKEVVQGEIAIVPAEDDTFL